jgi:hypothetical protein
VGLQRLITVLDMKKGFKGGVRAGFINRNDMYNNDVGQGGVYALCQMCSL